ncbi:O-linked N-acetylglucosamine transferase, SPINDLY family protein [Pseudanabaena sp. 'Roaring Creek']|uniref:O-linked N-acetylglucosamine transferase, SPINDLY family protein n=1 Tax=Pseudanabaena sp. 'Roaring Creek' TaxID=1681830 RepID=UPI0006D7862D|nr:O-linked N-acetylglucosamine transferase, SPINDLY family protein [Pseudanabaena sp. 'Roaring Creek']
MSNNVFQQAYEYLLIGEYSKASLLYEEAISEDPDSRENYWYLGLSMLLNGQELEAQLTWGMVTADRDLDEVEILGQELCQILHQEAERLDNTKEYAKAWLIRQHMREIAPQDFDNLVQIVYLELNLNDFSQDSLNQLNILELLQQEPNPSIQEGSVLQLVQNLLNSKLEYTSVLNVVYSCIPHIIHNPKEYIDLLLPIAGKLSQNSHPVAQEILETCLDLDPNNMITLGYLVDAYIYSGNYSKSVDLIQDYTTKTDNLLQKITIYFLLVLSLMSAGKSWKEAETAFNHYVSYLLQQAQQAPEVLTIYLCRGMAFAAYFNDNPRDNRKTQNQLFRICQNNQRKDSHIIEYSHHRDSALKRIGYLSTSLRSHSVGWLARWLFKYHDRSRFQIYGYFPQYYQGDSQQLWFDKHVDRSYRAGIECVGTLSDFVEQIYRDRIDILIDLDSLTSSTCCEIVSLKPAPLQVTWLGLDASGIPAMDYFIADKYVLPENAQEYYSEKIWRLPNSYIAVDGFEIGVPSLQRHHLNIPNDATIFLTTQKGYKRHSDTIVLQMKIIKAVPNSYFLIKGIAEEQSTQNLFLTIAEQEGVSPDRLRFLKMTGTEVEHRANLAIADVVLDTYPYNGATTTMETLWMCIPLVTRVGEQFASRNSYTMMMNAGITEGIAWTDEEYVEWGIRLGADESLRKEVFWKLKESRKISPLWNAKQFAMEMELAYEKMWEIYLLQ